MKKVREGYKCSSKGIIPNDWKVVNFKKCINISNGQVDPKEEPYCNMKHIGPGNIEKFTGKILYVNTAKEDMQTSGKYLFDKNDVLYGKINPQLGKVAYPQYEGICSADMYPMRADENYIKPLFLKYLLLSNDFFKYSVSVSMRTGMPKINREELNLYDFLLPTLQEQEKIASILSTVDEQIDNVDGLIEKNKELKKGLMQQLLTKGIGHTKFKKTEIGEIPEEWEVISLDEMLYRSYILGHLDGNHGGLYPKNSEFVDKGIPYVGANSIKDNRIDFNSVKYITNERARLFKKGIARNNDVLFAHNATVGPVALVESDYEFIILSTTLTYYRCNEEHIKSKYLMYYMQTEVFKKQYERTMGQTTRNQVPITMQKEFKHIIPSIDEQIKIASILSEVDEKIEGYQKKKRKLEELKRGLIQQLLVGKVRV